VIRYTYSEAHWRACCEATGWYSTEQWDKAHQDFFEAFKNYDEAGSPRRIQCLKYLVLANMLMQSAIDPFTAPETKPYKNDPEISAMTSLVNAYQRRDILEFENILKGAAAAFNGMAPVRPSSAHSGKRRRPHCARAAAGNRKTIMDDAFVRNYIEDLLRNIRTQVLLIIIKPYTQVSIPFLAKVRKTKSGTHTRVRY